MVWICGLTRSQLRHPAPALPACRPHTHKHTTHSSLWLVGLIQMVARPFPSTLALLLFSLYGFWLVLPPAAVSAIECFKYHDFSEEGKQRTITKGFCGASNGFCVKAVYSDPNFRHKNGISYGCDKTDCVGVGNLDYGWSPDGCKRNEDYGQDGFICCCTTELCNATAPRQPLLYSLCSLLSFLLFTRL
ncbi:hypothetical protein L596_003759 [Steinernema carpocapsae]|uniref:Uncharacterized protein n=1 Tax=Steinernema carpocapsae TaxID=34508 RepID=A0A4U8UUN1_STECR|nr:hypothetical protein L596_003759 [Steinernema carpocapsae]